MGETKFTPLEVVADIGHRAVVHGKRTRIVVDCRENFGDPAPLAHLIAAAPEMYEALKEVLESFAAPDAALEKVQRALARAEGRT